MADNNNTVVQNGLRIVRKQLADYIGKELKLAYGGNWWQEVLYCLDTNARDLPEVDDGNYEKLIDSLDIANCLRLFDRKWSDLFKKKLSLDYKTWAKELMGVRNKISHLGANDYSDDDTWRALDTMARFCEALDDDAAEELRTMARECRYGSAAGSTSVTEISSPGAGIKATSDGVQTKTSGHLPSWRSIMEPHPDVAQGRYKNAEFAVNLAQVTNGKGAIEYRDPVEFFARTYVTEGVKGLLVQAIRRVSGLDGEPVIQLKTAFGGGKTHSMLALYHMLRGAVPLEKMAGVEPVLEAAGVKDCPKVKVAVLVGTAYNPSERRKPIHLPGITINTLWGEMAAQLAVAAGDLSLYDYVKEADKKGVSPGHEAMKELFDACGPCMILMDELVAYGKKLYGVDGLPAGSFDNFISFIQEITEAASASKNSLVVASIPESDIEIGGESGTTVLEAIEHTFGRMESIWKPVAANEGFEVVRRRLFLDCKDPAARDSVCEAFSRMYLDNAADFPVSAHEVEYRDRMISCYPIHPEIFDHLYEEWSTLERFQRTRGVLRLMAAVIHELWMNQDASAMIMPGSLPLDVPAVRDELTRYLPEEWNGIVDAEVDGKKSTPYQMDKSTSRYGSVMAARRLSRTIMLGSAPSDRGQAVKGIEKSRIRLGTIQPEESIAVFNDALNALQGKLSYLYSSQNGDRFWYDTRPTLRKTMEDRAGQLSNEDVEYEIEERLKRIRKEAPFNYVHACPSSSLDVPDERAVRIVILPPSKTFRSNNQSCPAMEACADILNSRGTSPRIYRNMLTFLAPDADAIEALKQEVRRLLAWRSIKKESAQLNLDAAQNAETDSNISKSEKTVELRLYEAYCWLLTPYIDPSVDIQTIQWDEDNVRGGDDSIIQRIRRKMESDEALITKWAPSLLKMKLDQLLWKDKEDITIKQLWEYLCTYCYLPRLSSFDVLKEAIENGVNSSEYFAYASGKADDRYQDLKYNTYLPYAEESGYLVKIEVALKQLVAENATGSTEGKDHPTYPPTDQETTSGLTGVTGTTSPAQTGGQEQQGPQNTHFYLSTPLDITRINKDVMQLVQEVINHLNNIDGSEVQITLEVEAKMPDGTPQPIVRSVTENCNSLKVKNYGFDD